MPTTKFRNVRVFRNSRFVSDDFWIENEKIIDPRERFYRSRCDADHRPDVVIDGQDGIIVPGFIDLQLNGGFGIDFSDPAITVNDIVKAYRNVLPRFHQVINTQKQKLKGAKILGMHLEGPFINIKNKGAHEEDNIVEPVHGIKSLLERYTSLEHVAIITLAPELIGADKAVVGLVEREIIVSAGHSSATIAQAIQAVKSGVSMLTHLFNAMTPFHHRDPGLVGLLGYAEDARPFYGLIVDGEHSHETSATIAMKAHPDGLILVTDAMAGMGLPPGIFKLAEKSVVVTPDYRAHLANSATIAGSVTTMDRSIRSLYEYTNCPKAYAVEAATLHPAQVMKLQENIGTLDYGSAADFVLLDDNFKVQRTYVEGKLVYSSYTS